MLYYLCSDYSVLFSTLVNHHGLFLNVRKCGRKEVRNEGRKEGRKEVRKEGRINSWLKCFHVFSRQIVFITIF